MKKLLFLSLLFSSIHLAAQNNSVGIGTLTPDTTAILELSSPNQGLRLTRISSTAAILNPVKGLVVLAENDNKLHYYNGSAWKQLLFEEVDPKIGNNQINVLPIWNGTQMVTSSFFHEPSFSRYRLTTNLDVDGNIEANSVKINGGNQGFILRSADNNGNAEWVSPLTLPIMENDPQVNSMTAGRVPIWDPAGPFLTDGSITDINGMVGLSNPNPQERLDVNGMTKTERFQMTNNAVAGYYLRSDALGRGSWLPVVYDETDPQVSTYTDQSVPRTIVVGALEPVLVDGIMYDDGVNVGIGFSPSPGSRLSVDGRTTTEFLRITGSNPSPNNVLKADDANGNAIWANLATLESDPQVGSIASNLVPRWNGTTLIDGVLQDDATNVGVGTAPVANQKLTVAGKTTTTNLQMINGAANGRVLQSDASGNATWVDPSALVLPESDPQVGSTASNLVPRWDGTSLVDGVLQDDATNVGVGTAPVANQKLTVAGKTTTANLQMTNGATNGFVLQSDATGNAAWVNSTTLSVTESDPQVGSTASNLIPRWDGTSLVDGVLQDDATNVGVGTAPVANQKLTVGGKTTTTNLQMTNGATNGFVLQTDASGNGTWVNPGTIASGTLDQAYNFGSVGNGRTINAVDGAVKIQGFDGFLVTGEIGLGSNVEINGPGTRMFFNPRKAAFRAGSVIGNDWDVDSIGNFSMAFGRQTKAKGSESTAMGYFTSASGQTSTAMGEYSTSAGYASTSMGSLSLASGAYSLAMGFQTRAMGENSTATGKNTIASGTNSFTIGENTRSKGYCGFAIGMYNDSILLTDQNSISETTPLFIIGNGNSHFARSNALVVLKNGNVGIGVAPVANQKLTVGGKTTTTNLQMTSGAGANLVMQSDASGNASWVNSTSLAVTELDPQVGTITSGRIPRWNGSSLNDGVIQDDATNAGVGTAPVANQKLTVAGKTTTTNLQMTTGAGANLVMQSDASGNASWVNVNTLNANNIYNSNGTLTAARTLTQGSNAFTINNNGTQNTVINLSSTGDLDIQDNGVSTLYVDDTGNTGINTNAPQAGLHVKGVAASFDSHLRLETTGAATEYVNILYDGNTKFRNSGADDNYQWRNSANSIRLLLQDDGDLGIGVSDPLTRLHVNGALAVDDIGNIEVASDNQTITIGNSSYLRLSSNLSPASARTIVLSDGLVVGQMVFIECNETGVEGFEILDGAGSNTNTTGTIAMGGGDMIHLMWNGTDWLQISYSNN
jgi:hypothetical protein